MTPSDPPADPPAGPRAPAGAAASDPYDFSLVLGGPLYQIVRRAHLAGDALELLRRRLVVIPALLWLPLLILSAIGGRAWGDAVEVPFLKDVEVHARFLAALPLLILAELVVHQRMRPLARQFLQRGLIRETSRARFDAAVASAMRLRNSVLGEVLLLAFVYLVSLRFIWPQYVAPSVATWYAVPEGAGRRLSAAGHWFVYASLPLFQFILLRWYFRLFVWMRFLRHVAKCELRLVPTHPDRAGGLGFLSLTVTAFAPLLAAHGALLAGWIATRIFFQGASLLDFKVEIAVFVAFPLLVVLGPLLQFAPHLSEARRNGLREYGTLAQRYVRDFDDKWIRGGAPPDEPLIGSADLQSLADLGNSFEVVRGMRVLPFTKEALLQLAVVTLLPVAPLLLTLMPLETLLKRLLGVVF
ncbi:MAG: hypothetical protein L0323_09915 [Planctomycetes bacterium]|nr:hypothetical protein [Planctomycetota bacterium]